MSEAELRGESMVSSHSVDIVPANAGTHTPCR
jgi:hypothetical protein